MSKPSAGPLMAKEARRADIITLQYRPFGPLLPLGVLGLKAPLVADGPNICINKLFYKSYGVS